MGRRPLRVPTKARGSARIEAVFFALALIALPAISRAAEPTPEARKTAAKQFAEAERAYAAEDWSRAATAFEAAYRAVPHPDPLWNAARAWHRAGETARAANLYARYLREAPGSARDRPAAQKALAQLSQKLGRLELHVASGIDDVRIDGKPIEGDVVYVAPGAHVIEGHDGPRTLEQTATVAAGALMSVAVPETTAAAEKPVGVAEKPAVAPAAEKPVPPPPDKAETRSRGWSPLVVWIGAGATVVAGGVTVWSGLDTAAARREWDRAPTQSKLDDGRGKMTRTNVSIGVTVGLGVLTALAAVFLVDWRSGDTKVTIRAEPTGASLDGTF